MNEKIKAIVVLEIFQKSLYFGVIYFDRRFCPNDENKSSYFKAKNNVTIRCLPTKTYSEIQLVSRTPSESPEIIIDFGNQKGSHFSNDTLVSIKTRSPLEAKILKEKIMEALTEWSEKDTHFLHDLAERKMYEYNSDSNEYDFGNKLNFQITNWGKFIIFRINRLEYGESILKNSEFVSPSTALPIFFEDSLPDEQPYALNFIEGEINEKTNNHSEAHLILPVKPIPFKNRPPLLIEFRSETSADNARHLIVKTLLSFYRHFFSTGYGQIVEKDSIRIYKF